MYLALFALTTVVGTWAAWRSNPLYSLKGTLIFIGAVGLTAGAMVGLVIGVVNLTSGRPPEITIAAVLAVTALGTIAMIAVILALTSPRTPKLTPGTPVVHLHRDRVWIWAKNGTIALIAIRLIALVVPGDAKYVAYAIGGLALFLGAIMLFAGYLSARGLDLALTSIEADAWVHWRYDPDQWRRWIDVEIERTPPNVTTWSWRRDWKRLVIPLGGTAALVMLIDPGSPLFKLSYLGGLLVLGTLMVWLSNRYERAAPRRMRRLLTGAAPESYFGAAGVFADGVFCEWQNVSKYLVSASVDERDPRCIVLQFTEIPAGGAPPFATYVNVLIPSAADPDLDRLQPLIASAAPTADVAIGAASPAQTTSGDVAMNAAAAS